MRTVSESLSAPGSEGARRATGDSRARAPEGAPDPEVTERAKRRRFTAEYKLRILRKADACKGDGDVGALLRREGLYSSQLAAWRRQRDEIAKAGLKARKRGRKPKSQTLRAAAAKSAAKPAAKPAGRRRGRPPKQIDPADLLARINELEKNQKKLERLCAKQQKQIEKPYRVVLKR